jgi:hypothetical protein
MKPFSPGFAIVAALALGASLIPTKNQSESAQSRSVAPAPFAVPDEPHLHTENDPCIVLLVGRAASEAFTSTGALTVMT